MSKSQAQRLASMSARAAVIETMQIHLDKERKGLRREIRAAARAGDSRTKIMEAARISRRWLYVLLGE